MHVYREAQDRNALFLSSEGELALDWRGGLVIDLECLLF